MAKKKEAETPVEPEPEKTAEATTEGAGKGKKKCEKCGAYVGVRTRVCTCGAEFPPPAAKGEPRKRSGGTLDFAEFGKLLEKAKTLAHETGTVSELLEEIERFESLGDDFGGLANLKQALKFLQDLGTK